MEQSNRHCCIGVQIAVTDPTRWEWFGRLKLYFSCKSRVQSSRGAFYRTRPWSAFCVWDGAVRVWVVWRSSCPANKIIKYSSSTSIEWSPLIEPNFVWQEQPRKRWIRSIDRESVDRVGVTTTEKSKTDWIQNANEEHQNWIQNAITTLDDDDFIDRPTLSFFRF